MDGLPRADLCEALGDGGGGGGGGRACAEGNDEGLGGLEACGANTFGHALVVECPHLGACTRDARHATADGGEHLEGEDG